MAADPNENKFDLDTYAGVSFSCAVTLADEAGAVYPLTGVTVTAHIRFGSPDAPGAVALAVDEDTGRLSRDPDTGTVAWAIRGADLTESGLAVGDYWYELLVWSGGEAIDRPCWGYVQHHPTGAGGV